MCFTVNVNLVIEEIENRFGATFLDPDKYFPSYYYHAFSFPELPVICSDKPDKIRLLKWGLIPSWVKSKRDAELIRAKTLNARAESVLSKPSFSGSFRTKRCLIPVQGFYEWQHAGDKKIPWYIYRADNKIMTLAGLYDQWTDAFTGDSLETFSVVTTEANNMMAKIHNSARRMPLVLDYEGEKRWLDLSVQGENSESLLVPCREETLKAHTISDMINKKTANRNTSAIIKPFNYPVEGLLF